LQGRAQLDVFLETADCREILVVHGRQLLPRAALRNNIAGGIPDRQLTENLTVVFADHRSYRPTCRKALAHVPTLPSPSSSRAGREQWHTIKQGHLEKLFSPSRCESDSLTAMGHGRMERASHGANGLFRC